MGSLAKGEATPYSDLEFMLLVEHKSSSTLAYFELLSMTIYFLIGNLKETKLKYMNIKELKDFNDKGMNGYKIDGLQPKAGNIPTGNGTPEQKNKFILTVEELIDKYREVFDNPDPQDSLKGDLTAMLAHTALMYGDPKLLHKFDEAKLGTPKNSKRKEADFAMLEQDIADYDFIPLDSLRDGFYKVNLKSALYRFPSIVIYDLKLVYNIESRDSWQTLERLYGKNLISQSFYNSLKLLLATAQYSRLSTYLFHNSQNEAVTFLQKSEAAQSMRGSSGLWHMPYPLMFHMSLHIIGVKENITEKGVTEALRTKTNFLTDHKDIRLAKLHCILENHLEAIRIFESQDALSMRNKVLLVDCYTNARQFEKANSLNKHVYAEIQGSASNPSNRSFIEYMEQRLENEYKEPIPHDKPTRKRKTTPKRRETDETNPISYQIYLDQAKTHSNRQEYDAAERCFDKSWRAWHSVASHYSIEINKRYKAEFHYSRGVLLIQKKMFLEAKEFIEKSLRLCEDMYGSDSKSDFLGHCCNQMANILTYTNDKERAIEYYRLAIPCLGYPNHTTGMIYLNLGMAFKDLERYQEAEENLLHAQLVVSTKSPTEHYDLAEIKEHLGYVLMYQNRKAEALLYFKAGMDMHDVANKVHLAGVCMNRATELIQESMKSNCNFYTLMETRLHEWSKEREFLASKDSRLALRPEDYSLAHLFAILNNQGGNSTASTLILVAKTIKIIKKWCIKNILIKRIINPECPMPVYEFETKQGVMVFL